MDLSKVLDFLDQDDCEQSLTLENGSDESGSCKVLLSCPNKIGELNPGAPEFLPLNFSLYDFGPASTAMHQLNPDAADFIPTMGGMATLQAEADLWVKQQQVQAKGQLPYATDEEWEQRFVKRKKEVDTIKSLPSYKMYLELVPRESRIHEGSVPPDPLTPDPRDRNVSKRMWKWNVEKWRLQLKNQYGTIYSRTMLLQLKASVAARCSADDVAGGLNLKTLHRREIIIRAEQKVPKLAVYANGRNQHLDCFQ